jgi:uncharacterized protein (TIGR04141 family)
MTDSPRRRLRILRFRPGATVEGVVRADRLREIAPASSLGPRARIFIVDPDQPPSRPVWLPFVAEAAGEPLPEIAAPLNGAIIFLERRDRLWGLTFGTGHLFIDEDEAEQRFGLKAALNLINAEQLRSVGSRIYDDVVVRTTRQVSRRSGRAAFTIDDTRDILRDVTGAPTSPSWGTEVTGGTALSLSVPAEPDGLLSLLDRVADAHAQDTYKLAFGFIDHIAPVSDAEILRQLDDDVMRAILGEKQSDIYLAPPEPIVYEDVGGFCFFRERADDAHGELDLLDYRRSVVSSTLSLHDVHTNTVRLMSASGTEKRSWSIYRCIVYETSLAGRSFLLAEGEWFEVDPSFVQQIDREIALIKPPTIALPPARWGEDEPTYNSRAAREAGLALLDNKPISIGDSDVEIADLLSSNGEFIHVKRKTASRTLSHLFAQGRISAAVLKADPAARAATMAILAGDARPEATVLQDPYDMRAKTVVYAVVADNAADLPGKLPFFSRLNLWQARRFLAGQLDYQVTFVGIPITKK